MVKIYQLMVFKLSLRLMIYVAYYNTMVLFNLFNWVKMIYISLFECCIYFIDIIEVG